MKKRAVLRERILKYAENERKASRVSLTDLKHRIPDFKTLHSAHEQSVAKTKEQKVHPTVPKPIEFYTDLRAKKRGAFEEKVKSKESEMEKERRMKRREMEMKEEKERKQARRKLVPKANEVPEWYKDAPKKRKMGADD